MSSHHIVRDQQEPALLILEGDDKVEQLISGLLEWSPIVITTSLLAEKLISFGFKVDVVLYPVDELERWKQTLLHHSPLKLISYEDVNAALDSTIYYLRGIKHSALNVLTSQVTLEELQLVDGFRLIYYDLSSYKWFYCDRAKFKKWIPGGRSFRYFNNSATMEISIEGEPIEPLLDSNYYQFTSQNEGFLEMVSDKTFWLGERVE